MGLYSFRLMQNHKHSYNSFVVELHSALCRAALRSAEMLRMLENPSG